MQGLHHFLSDEWIEAVRSLKAAAADNAADTPGFVVNATITDVPFGDGRLEVHSDHGPTFFWEKGHSPDATVTFTVSYQFARALVVDDSPDFTLLTSEIDSRALQIEGDGDALREWFRTRIGNPELIDLERAIRNITI